MDRFLSLLVVSPLADGKTWVLVKEFDFNLAFDDAPRTIAVQAGFQTDFASIPRPLWVLLPKWGKYGNAAVVHDWLYWVQPKGMSRSLADLALLRGMRVLRVAAWQQAFIYAGVRAFGWLAWMRNGAERHAGYDRVLPELPTDATAISTRRGQAVTLARHCARRLSNKSAA